MAHISRLPPTHIVHERTRQVNRLLDIARNRFSGTLACQLRPRHNRIIYRKGAVGFRFFLLPSMTDAVSRINSGDGRAVRDDPQQLIQQGTPIDNRSEKSYRLSAL